MDIQDHTTVRRQSSDTALGRHTRGLDASKPMDKKKKQEDRCR